MLVHVKGHVNGETGCPWASKGAASAFGKRCSSTSLFRPRFYSIASRHVIRASRLPLGSSSWRPVSLEIYIQLTRKSNIFQTWCNLYGRERSRRLLPSIAHVHDIRVSRCVRHSAFLDRFHANRGLPAFHIQTDQISGVNIFILKNIFFGWQLFDWNSILPLIAVALWLIAEKLESLVERCDRLRFYAEAAFSRATVAQQSRGHRYVKLTNLVQARKNPPDAVRPRRK